MMTDAAASLSPRQRDCLRLVWDRHATSKEIAAQLNISKSTVDGYIAEAVEQLGARDRREAAAMAFGTTPRGSGPRAVSGGEPARVGDAAVVASQAPRSTDAFMMSRPWRTSNQPRNSLLLGQTLSWIAIIAVGSLVALALATSVGNGLPSVAKPVIDAVRRLTL